MSNRQATDDYIIEVYPNMPTLIVMKSCGYDFEIPADENRTEIIDAFKLLKRLWFPVANEADLKGKNLTGNDIIVKPKLWERRNQWLKPVRVNEQGCIESRDENGDWFEVEMFLVMKEN